VRKLAAITFLICSTSFALAVQAPKLPKEAKKLKTAEIEAIYNDKTLSGEYYGDKVLITWTSTNTVSDHTVNGTWSGSDGSKGTTYFKYAIKNDKWCITAKGSKKESCVDIYADATYGYEVKKGVVATRYKLH
jgi:dolichyl-phosphate-mannose--protein O-mannosyl transferase